LSIYTLYPAILSGVLPFVVVHESDVIEHTLVKSRAAVTSSLTSSSSSASVLATSPTASASDAYTNERTCAHGRRQSRGPGTPGSPGVRTPSGPGVRVLESGSPGQASWEYRSPDLRESRSRGPEVRTLGILESEPQGSMSPDREPRPATSTRLTQIWGVLKGKASLSTALPRLLEVMNCFKIWTPVTKTPWLPLCLCNMQMLLKSHTVHIVYVTRIRSFCNNTILGIFRHGSRIRVC